MKGVPHGLSGTGDAEVKSRLVGGIAPGPTTDKTTPPRTPAACPVTAFDGQSTTIPGTLAAGSTGSATVDEEGYAAILMADEAVRIIERGGNRPFYLQVAFNVPHFPILAPAEAAGRVADRPPLVIATADLACIDGDWKLIVAADGTEELYDLGTNPGEQRDLSAAETDRAAALRARLAEIETGFQPARSSGRGPGRPPAGGPGRRPPLRPER